jgi:hypothetical protein
MDGNRRVIARLRRVYAMFGAPDDVAEHVSQGGHAYRPDLRVAVFRFLNRHLKNDTGPVRDADFPPIEGRDLRVFPEDKDLPADAVNDRADEVFVPAAEVKLPEKQEDFPAWKSGLVRRLRERSFRALPARGPGKWAGDRHDDRTLFESEPGITVPVRMLKNALGKEKPADPWATLIVLNADEDPEAEAKFWAKRYPNDVLVHAIAPRGCGAGRWTRKNPPNTVERSLALLGQTVDSGRVWDVAALQAQFDTGVRSGLHQLRVVGRGQAGAIAAYAALFAAPRFIGEVAIIDPPASHRGGPHFLNVQRVLDIPDALGLLAPDVRLTLLGAKDRAFDKTAEIYRLAGTEGKFRREK